jgi:hypothetical protein
MYIVYIWDRKEEGGGFANLFARIWDRLGGDVVYSAMWKWGGGGGESVAGILAFYNFTMLTQETIFQFTSPFRIFSKSNKVLCMFEVGENLKFNRLIIYSSGLFLIILRLYFFSFSCKWQFEYNLVILWSLLTCNIIPNIEKSLLLTQTARFSKNRVRCVSQ